MLLLLYEDARPTMLRYAARINLASTPPQEYTHYYIGLISSSFVSPPPPPPIDPGDRLQRRERPRGSRPTG